MRKSVRRICLRCLPSFFFLNNRATTEIYPLPLHDALPISAESFEPPHQLPDEPPPPKLPPPPENPESEDDQDEPEDDDQPDDDDDDVEPVESSIDRKCHCHWRRANAAQRSRATSPSAMPIQMSSGRTTHSQSSDTSESTVASTNRPTMTTKSCGIHDRVDPMPCM